MLTGAARSRLKSVPCEVCNPPQGG
jgi:hypothetical protein